MLSWRCVRDQSPTGGLDPHDSLLVAPGLACTKKIVDSEPYLAGKTGIGTQGRPKKQRASEQGMQKLPGKPDRYDFSYTTYITRRLCIEGALLDVRACIEGPDRISARHPRYST